MNPLFYSMFKSHPVHFFALWIAAIVSSCQSSNESSISQPLISTIQASSEPYEISANNPYDSTLNALVSGKRHLEIFGAVEVKENLIIPYGHTVEVKSGGFIYSKDSLQLDIYGNFIAGNYQTFSENLLVKFGAGSVEKVNVNWFGAFADTQLTNGQEGNDDTDQIQAAIEAAEFVKNVYLPSYRLPDFKWYGAYRISKTLQVRVRGKKFLGISLFGEDSYDKPKSVIYADFTSGGAINIQSARGSVIANLAISGKNTAPQENKEAYSNLLDDYVSGGIETQATKAYSGITIDAKEGEPGSANTIIRNCRISRFYVGIYANAAGGTQGDMLSITYNALEYNAIHFVVGNSQARSISISRCDIGRGHTVLDNLSVGPRLGSTVNFSDNQITNCYQLLNYSTAAGGPSEMSGNYGENMGRIGIVMGGNNQNTLTIRDGTLKFAPTGYKVKTFFEGQANLVISSCLIQVNGKENLIFNNTKNTHFEHTRFRGKRGMPTVSGEKLQFKNCTVSNASREIPVNAPMDISEKP